MWIQEGFRMFVSEFIKFHVCTIDSPYYILRKVVTKWALFLSWYAVYSFWHRKPSRAREFERERYQRWICHSYASPELQVHAYLKWSLRLRYSAATRFGIRDASDQKTLLRKRNTQCDEEPTPALAPRPSPADQHSQNKVNKFDGFMVIRHATE